jgi:hypothetical protein
MTVVFDREPYGLRLLRRAATNDYSANLLSSEAADVVAEIERLWATVAALQAAVPPAHPADYGHETWSAALEIATLRAWAERAAKDENENAENARRERAAVVATLRRTSNHLVDLDSIANDIERGEHRREEKP